MKPDSDEIGSGEWAVEARGLNARRRHKPRLTDDPDDPAATVENPIPRCQSRKNRTGTNWRWVPLESTRKPKCRNRRCYGEPSDKSAGDMSLNKRLREIGKQADDDGRLPEIRPK